MSLARIVEMLTAGTAKVQSVAGTALMGKVSIDQTTDGTTNRVVAKISQTAGENLVALSGSTAIKGAVINNAAAGTELQVSSSSYPCREVTIIAKRTNTGYIYIGGSDVSSTVYGAELAAKDSITLAVSNLNLVYFDASVSGEGISYVAI